MTQQTCNETACKNSCCVSRVDLNTRHTRNKKTKVHKTLNTNNYTQFIVNNLKHCTKSLWRGVTERILFSPYTSTVILSAIHFSCTIYSSDCSDLKVASVGAYIDTSVDQKYLNSKSLGRGNFHRSGNSSLQHTNSNHEQLFV